MTFPKKNIGLYEQKVGIMKLKEKILNSYFLQSSKHKLNNTQKANLLFDIVLELIITNKWTYFAKGNGYNAEYLLDCDCSDTLQVNCFELSDLFIALCKQVGITNLSRFVYKHKPSSKIGQKIYEKNSESKYTFQCFDKEFECIDNQVCFDQHCVALVNGRFYDLIFSSSYELMETPYDVGPFAEVISFLDSENGDEALSLLQTCKEIDLKQTFQGETLLHIATRLNHVPLISFLLDKGIDINFKGDVGWTLLHFAANSNNLGIVKFLLDKGANANIRDDENMVPLQYVVDSELHTLLTEYTDRMIVEDIKQNKLQQDFNNAVDIIINRRGTTEEFFEAIQGIDINFKGDGGWTLLHFAASLNNLDIVEFLLDKGANANIRNDKNMVPLHYAGEKDSPMYRLLSNETEKSIMEVFSEETDLTSDLSNLPAMDKPKFVQPNIIQNVEIHEHNVHQSKDSCTSPTIDISMQVLGGFMSVIGCAAVATAFLLLNVSTLGIAGLVSGLGVASLLIGVGLFGTSTYKNLQTTPADYIGNSESLLVNS